jgi:hypothetical protein
MLGYFFLIIILIFQINNISTVKLTKDVLIPNKDKENNHNIDKYKLIQCKLCQEMFEFNFNFEDLLKSGKVNTIHKAFEILEKNKEELNGYFSKDNLEFVTQEISMQYFLKGIESQFEEVMKGKDCKAKKVGKDEECDKTKLEICENVLSYEKGLCVDMKNDFKTLLISLKSKVINNENKSKPTTHKENDNNIINFRKFQFRQKNEDKDPEMIKRFGDVSLLEMNTHNFDNISNPQKDWRPSKPVILDNFEKNIGDQLKDISVLAR